MPLRRKMRRPPARAWNVLGHGTGASTDLLRMTRVSSGPIFMENPWSSA